MSRIGLALTAATAAVLLVAGWMLLAREQVPMGACVQPTEQPPAPAAAPPGVDAPLIEWSAVPVAAGLTDPDEQGMRDVAPFGGGFVATGTESSGGDWRSFVLWSADGMAWSEVGGAMWLRAEIHALRVVGARLFALGSASTNDRGGSRGVIAFTDDGTTWHHAEGDLADARPHTLAGDEDGLILVGRRFADETTVAWRSRDGTTWQAVELDLPVSAAVAGIEDVTTDDGRWVAIGSISAGPDSPAWPVAWTSDDGVRWTCTLLDAAGFEVARPTRLHRAPGAWLATGVGGAVCGPAASCVGTPMAWTSSDGVSWSAALGGAEPIAIGGVAIAAAPAGFIAVGQGNTWTSHDGSSWARAETGESGHAIQGQTDALALAPDGTVAVATGTYWPGDATDADPWIAVGEIVADP